ncbi:hypothetical protein PT974_08823 [Cladobotryum mycophilum]|uniref:Uncharacterized protein n=1 Tax=Cladobotryum mycophilum TaxID=491253 RepID=A0ABR0SEJ5_9HYPO
MVERIVVAIDIGTEENHISPVSFTVGDDAGSSRTPTRFIRKFEKNEVVCFKYFKYLLLDKKDVPDHIATSSMFQTACALQERLNWDVVYMVGQFFVDACMSEIPCVDGRRAGHYHFVMTVPASWPSYVAHRLKKALQASEIAKNLSATLEFVTESEAALLASRDQCPLKWAQAGDVVTVCDVGAWTAFLLDEACIRLFEAKTGKPRESWCRQGEYITVPIDLEWDLGIKNTFRDESKTWMINIRFHPWEVSRVSECSRIKLGSEERMFVLCPLLSRIRDLARQHEDELIREHGQDLGSVIFVGGVAEAPYAVDLLCSIFQSSYVLESRAYEPRTASSYGAVLYGLLGNSTSHVPAQSLALSLSYGFARDWKGGKCVKPKKLWDSNEGREINAEGACWAVRKGTLNSMRRRSFKCEQILLHPDERPYIYFYTSPLDDPPRNKTEGELLFKLRWQRTFQKELLKTKVTELGQVYYTAAYLVVFEACGDSLEVTIEALNTRILGTYNVANAFEVVEVCESELLAETENPTTSA